jgi:hypothetical protein
MRNNLAGILAAVLSFVALPATPAAGQSNMGQPKSWPTCKVGIPARIDAQKLTHINYAFARIEANRALLDRPSAATDLAQ